MGWLIMLAKKRYGQAKSLVKKAAPQVKEFLNALPTVNVSNRTCIKINKNVSNRTKKRKGLG